MQVVAIYYWIYGGQFCSGGGSNIPVHCPGQRRTRNCQTLSQMSVMFRTSFRRLVWRRRLWSRCASLWSFRRDRGGGGGGCDPVLPLPVCKGQDFLVEDGPDVIVSGRESIITESDVSCEICVVSDQLPVVVPKLAAVPLAVSVATGWLWPGLALAGGQWNGVPR